MHTSSLGELHMTGSQYQLCSIYSFGETLYRDDMLRKCDTKMQVIKRSQNGPVNIRLGKKQACLHSSSILGNEALASSTSV